MLNLLLIFLGAVLVNNFVLVRFLGLCPFLGVSGQLPAACGMGVTTTSVLVLAAAGSWTVNRLVLLPLGLTQLDIIADIVLIAVTVQVAEILIRLWSTELYNALGIYLPLITTNCIVLGLVLLNEALSLSFVEALVHALGAGCGFLLVLVPFAAIRERLITADVPEAFRNTPVALITAGLMSLAFMGFAGLAGSSV